MLHRTRAGCPCAEHAHAGERQPLRAELAATLVRRGLLMADVCNVAPCTFHLWPTAQGTTALALDAAARGGTLP